MGTSRATSRRNSSVTTQIEVVVGEKKSPSWWKKVEHCTQSRTHAMLQTIDYRFELSTVHVADNQLPVRNHAGKKKKK